MPRSLSHKELEQKIQELERTCLDRTQNVEKLAIYRDILSSTPDGIAFLDKRYRYMVVNSAYERFSGVKEEELIGVTVSEYLGKDIFEEHIKPHFDRCLEGEIINFQEWFEYSVMGRRFMDITYYPFRDSENVISGVIANTRDITERKYTEEEQQITMSLLQVLHEETDRRGLARRVTSLLQEWSKCEAVGIRLQQGEDFPYFETRGFSPQFVANETQLCAVDRQGKIIYGPHGNPVLECMCGMVIKGHHGGDLPFITEQGSFWTNSTSELLKSFKGTGLGNQLRGHCHAAGYESVALVPMHCGQQRIGLLQFNDRQKGRFNERIIKLFERLASNLALGFQQRAIAMVLRESETKYKSLVNNIPGVVYQFKMTAGGEQSIVFMGEGCYELFGLNPDEILADPATLFDRIPQEDSSKVQQAIIQSAETLLHYDLEHRIKHTDGRMLWLRAISTPRRQGNGDIIWDGLCVDISKRKKIETDLLQSYEDTQIRQQITKHFLTSPHDELFHTVVELLLIRFGVEHGYIGYIDESGDLVCPSLRSKGRSEWGMPNKSNILPKNCWRGIWGQSLREKSTILCNHPAAHFEDCGRIDNALIVPLIVDGVLAGQIALANKKAGFTSTDQWQLESFADFISPVLKIYLEKETANKELHRSIDKLEQTNIALNVMIDKCRDEKKELSRTIQENFDRLVFPFHETIKKSNSKEEILLFLDIIKENTITSLLSLDPPAPSDHLQFTPKEAQVARLIKAGQTSKEIASSLHISLRSVFFHRNNIRKKLNIQKKKTNLRTFLSNSDF